MYLFENEDMETIDLEQVATDCDLLMYGDVKVNKKPLVLYFNADKSLVNIGELILVCPFTLDVVGEKEISVKYTPVEFDTEFTMDILPDGIFDAEETEDGFMVNVSLEDLYDLASVLEANFEREIIWPFDNASKNDMVEKALAKLPDVEKKIRYYIDKGVYSVEEYRSVHQSWSNQTTREKKKQDEIDKWRAGRTDLEILRDELKQVPDVVSVEITEARGSKYPKLLTVICKSNNIRIIYEILSNARGTFFLARKKGKSFNSYRSFAYKDILRWIVRNFDQVKEQELTSKMTNRERMEYNLRKSKNLPKDEIEDDDDDSFDTSWLDDEDEKLERSRK